MIKEDDRVIPVAGEYDVLVAGGGPAGFAAAVAAGRLGVKVLLIERYGFLGGMVTAGLVNPFQVSSVNGAWIIKGIFREVVERLRKISNLREEELFSVQTVAFDPEALKLALFEMGKEANCKLLLHSFANGAILKGKSLRGITVTGKSGEQRLVARVTVDATGDADLAYLAGVPCEKGRPEDGLMQPMTLNFTLAGVDTARMPSREEMDRLYSRVKTEKRLTIPREKLLWFYGAHAGEIHVNTVRITEVDGTDTGDLTSAELEGRRQMEALIGFLRTEVSGFENSYLKVSGTQIGVRETRRIRGEYILTGEDVLGGKKFDDVIARGSFPIDIHNPRGEGTVYKVLPPGISYQIPYRCLLPLGVEHLLVAGRPISVTHEAHSSTRVAPTAMAVGQAAGVAAALAVKERISPRRIKVVELQKILREQGADLG